MFKKTTFLTLTLLASLAAASFGQKLELGAKAPKIPTEELINTKFKSPADLKGKLMLVEFFAFW